jgi:hypothetical protein
VGLSSFTPTLLHLRFFISLIFETFTSLLLSSSDLSIHYSSKFYTFFMTSLLFSANQLIDLEAPLFFTSGANEDLWKSMIKISLLVLCNSGGFAFFFLNCIFFFC